MTEEEKLLQEYRKEFENKTVEVLPFEVNGTTYEKFEMKYPTFAEIQLHYDAIDDSTSKKGQAALFELAKICTTNVKKPSDFLTFPSYAVYALIAWVGKHIA